MNVSPSAHVRPTSRGVDLVDAHDERLAGARAANLERPFERVAGTLGTLRLDVAGSQYQPAFGAWNETEPPGSTVSTGS